MAIAWWLVPTSASAKPLESAIQHAAAKHNAPTFPAHVTLFSLPSSSKTTDVLVQATKSTISSSSSTHTTTGVISLEQSQVQVGETFHQSVFLALKPTPTLTSLRSSLLKAVGASAKTESPHFPHASLYYGEGSADDKHHVVASLMDARAVDIAHDGTVHVSHFGPEGVQFDAVWIVNIAGNNPSDWIVLHRESLAPAPASDVKEDVGASSTAVSPTTTTEVSGTTNSHGGSRLSYIAEMQPARASAPIPKWENGTIDEKAPPSAPAPAPAPNTKDESAPNEKEKERAPTPARSEPSKKAENMPKEGFGAKLKRLLCF